MLLQVMVTLTGAIQRTSKRLATASERFLAPATCPTVRLRSVWIKTTDLNGLANMTLVQMNCSMEREKDRKPGKQKNFCLRYWLMEVWHKRKLRKKQKNWELKRKH